jgi:diguanylate cyclase (GGDEF)-like protein
MVPASVPIMLPTHGWLDAAMRAALLGLLGTLVFLRLVRSIQALRAAEAEIHARATHDTLTGLPNRLGLLEQLGAELAQAREDDVVDWVNVLMVDCDNFKQVNDSWGHAAGDEVLIEYAARLRRTAGPDALLARIGGDEFVVVVTDAELERVTDLAEAVIETFREPIVVSQQRRTLLTPTIGVARALARDVDNAEDLVRDADIALYEAKDLGGASLAVYDASMQERIARRHKLADALRSAIELGQITVQYQPIRAGVDFSDLIGWEALARWEHPECGPVPPLEFIPIAEDTGLIMDLGAHILRVAARQLKVWQVQFRRPDLHMAVNVSSVQLVRVDLVALVTEVLADTGLTHDSLWIEITESVVLERSEMAMRNVVGLNRLGVTLCIDDFGTGYSSLSYLKDFVVNVLKIDRSFTRHLIDDPHEYKLTKAIIDLSRSLGLEGVVAEGVENEEQAEALTRLGCTLAQGYLFGRPVPAAEATSAAADVLTVGVSTSRSTSRASGPPVPSPRGAGGSITRSSDG